MFQIGMQGEHGASSLLVTAEGEVKHSPFPQLEVGEVESVKRFILMGPQCDQRVSNIEVSSGESNPEKENRYNHNIKVTFSLDLSTFSGNAEDKLTKYLAKTDWFGRHDTVIKLKVFQIN